MNQKVKDVHTKIKEWLLEEGYSIKQNKDAQALFNYTISKGTLPPLNVAQPKETKDSIGVVFSLNFDIKSAKKIRGNDEMLWEIKKWLLQSGCRFAFIPQSKPFNVIRVYRTLFYDGLTKNSFFRTIEKVVDAGLFVLLTIKKEIGEMPEPKPQDTYVA